MKRLIFMTLLLLGSKVQAAPMIKGFVQVRPKQRLYVEYRPALNGKETLFLANGLTYSTKQWQDFVDALDPELGVVRYDMEGMGKTLLDKAPITFDILLESQTRDLKDLRTKLNIQGPTALIGLSYGGAVALDYLATYPEDFDKVIAMAPFLQRLPDQDEAVLNMVALHNLTFPFDMRSSDEIYDYYLRLIIFTTYPLAEPIVLENKYKLEGVYRMVKGAKNWRAADLVEQFPPGKLYLMAGEDDPYVKLPYLQEFWKNVPSRAKAGFITLHGVHHKIPEEVPELAAKWVTRFLSEKPEAKQTTGSRILNLGAKTCEALLRKVSGRR